MNHSLKFLSCLFITVILSAPHLLLAQQTSAITDTSKADTAKKKPVFTLQTLRVQPLYVFEINDNAKINADSQFSGTRAVPSSTFSSGTSHLQNVRQLTFEGVNTRPSVSPDGRYIAFQAHGVEPNSCDQIYRLPLATGVPAGRISNGKGEAQDAAFLNNDQIVYSSTQALYNGACPQKSLGPSDLYISDTNGKEIRRLTNSKHYNGDVFISPTGDRIFFLSDRERGHSEFFTIKPDASDLHQLSHQPGFNAGSVSPDGKEIVASKNGHESGIYIMDADGAHGRQLTHDGEEPCWSPDGQHIIYCESTTDSNALLDLYRMKNDGSDVERLTTGGDFEFPIFTPDGKQLIFCSSRNATHPGDVNIFVADWLP